MSSRYSRRVRISPRLPKVPNGAAKEAKKREIEDAALCFLCELHKANSGRALALHVLSSNESIIESIVSIPASYQFYVERTVVQGKLKYPLFVHVCLLLTGVRKSRVGSLLSLNWTMNIL